MRTLISACLLILAVTGCASAPVMDESTPEGKEAALEHRIAMNKKAIEGTCFYPDGLFIEAPEWICKSHDPLTSVGMYAVTPAGYQHARNMAYLQAVREISRRADEEIRSLSKSYTGVTGKGRLNHDDEDVIQALVFKVVQNTRVETFIVSPNKDLYVLVTVGDVSDINTGRQGELWQQYKAKQAHDELDKKFQEYKQR